MSNHRILQDPVRLQGERLAAGQYPLHPTEEASVDEGYECVVRARVLPRQVDQVLPVHLLAILPTPAVHV